jgi:hypothetical protein
MKVMLGGRHRPNLETTCLANIDGINAIVNRGSECCLDARGKLYPEMDAFGEE